MSQAQEKLTAVEGLDEMARAVAAVSDDLLASYERLERRAPHLLRVQLSRMVEELSEPGDEGGARRDLPCETADQRDRRQAYLGERVPQKLDHGRKARQERRRREAPQQSR